MLIITLKYDFVNFYLIYLIDIIFNKSVENIRKIC